MVRHILHQTAVYEIHPNPDKPEKLIAAEVTKNAEETT